MPVNYSLILLILLKLHNSGHIIIPASVNLYNLIINSYTNYTNRTRRCPFIIKSAVKFYVTSPHKALSGQFELKSGQFEPKSGHFEPRSGHFEPESDHCEPKSAILSLKVVI